MNTTLRGSLSRFICVFFLLCAPASAQILKIRVINVKNGQPLPKQVVLVNFLYDHRENAPSNVESNLHLSTGADGIVSFPLPDRAPEHLGIQVKLTLDSWRCGCYVLAATPDVLSKGLLSSPSGATVPQPGEIVFTARPPTFFERIFDPLLRD